MSTQTDPPSDFLTLKDAARVFDVSASTLQRRRRSGDLENVGAHRMPDGTWRIPAQGLALLGYRLREGATDTPDTPRSVTPSGTPTAAHGGTPMAPVTPGADTPSADTRWHPPAEEVASLREQLAAAEQRAAVAEAVAAERGRALEDMRTTLRLLEAPRAAERSADPEPSAAPAEPAPSPAASGPREPRGERRGWVGRLLRRD